MRVSMIVLSLFVLLTPFASVSLAETNWNVGVSGDSEGIRGFYLSVGDYYRVPEREVVVVRERGIRHDEELPVVFFLAQRARVSPNIIVDLRLRGMSWMDITLHYGLSPEIYYVPVKAGKEGPPYGHAYGYYKKHPKKAWKKIVLRDEDIIDQVNTRFISEYHHYSPEQVMKYRSEGRNFVGIDRDVRAEKHGKEKDKDRKEGKRHEKEEKKEQKHNGKGKGNKKGND